MTTKIAKLVQEALDSGLVLSNPLVLDLKSFDITNEQLVQFCADNGDLRFELTAKKELLIMPPEGLKTGARSAVLLRELAIWARDDGRGLAFGSSAGFRLPNGAMRAADACWILASRWDALPEDEQELFAHIVPDFVVELRSRSDTVRSQQNKMVEYLENGVLLGWLVDPYNRTVHIYRAGQPVEVLEDPETVSGDPVLSGFELNLQEIW